MFEQNSSISLSTLDDYSSLASQLKYLTQDEPNLIANLANISAVLFDALSDVNWVGFYLKEKDQNELVLGPFQGKVACVRIPWGKGVCGTAAAKNETQHIDDVHAFPGHIACDSASESEVVIPIMVEGQVVAVLDIDSPKLSRFSDVDVQGLELLKPILENLVWR
ncbi:MULTISPECIES: GAF domain-containing protein [Gammaproteobacteria]|uniref:GAF domain-containing protein n=1 Tax=Gammaproteobacteria TaxID=1236 RepID=UPI000DD0A46F|nr:MULTISPECIES: GAF domain-containing protein [Gammaproteobacteria]RTE87208.1 GAF domain-containing protein [Aliidiomarina sp. B3213]TCZ93004.1 GAF domain-containing protein [Lysobacter sp. N42]